MSKFPGTIRVKMINPELGVWYASSPLHKTTPELTIKYLNKLAKGKGIETVYELATEEEYWGYRDSRKAARC
jgi:hypothetical protein